MNNANELEQLPVAPPHKSHRWLAIIVIFFLWILFAGGMLITSHKIFIYTPHANILGDLAAANGTVKLSTLNFCTPMIVVKEDNRFCMAALWPSSCIFQFSKEIPDGTSVEITPIKPTLAIGMSSGLIYEIITFKKCLQNEISKANENP